MPAAFISTAPDIHTHKILILDFGSQYTQLIARRVRELGVYCEIYPYDVGAAAIKKFAPQGIILSGSPQTVTAKNSPRAPQLVFKLGCRCPVLGICYGMQTMAAQHRGGAVSSSAQREYGYAKLVLNNARGEQELPSPLLAGLKNEQTVWMSHGDKVTRLPHGFKATASTSSTPFAVIEDTQRGLFGVQFHPEVTHTAIGKIILRNFIYTICKCKKLWTAKNIIKDAVLKLKSTLGNDKVLLALSGGVDSGVTALLLQQAIEDNLTCVFVDTGLLRLGESEQTMALFAEHFKLNVIRIDAQKQFLKALAGTANPEAKRKIIGREFIKVFTATAKKLRGNHAWLAQGTIYPDVIESAHSKCKKAEVIKSHHNVGGLPKKMHLRLVEPLRELFKDEVRKIGLALGLAPAVIYRHPFPGPGLAVRVIGTVKPQYLDILRQVDNIFLDELCNAQLYNKVSQAFAVFLPVKSVGVMGDARKYDYVVALRAVETIDFMTAHWANLPHKFLSKVSNRIINEVAGVSRVVYDISSKPPATIEWE